MNMCTTGSEELKEVRRGDKVEPWKWASMWHILTFNVKTNTFYRKYNQLINMTPIYFLNFSLVFSILFVLLHTIHLSSYWLLPLMMSFATSDVRVPQSFQPCSSMFFVEVKYRLHCEHLNTKYKIQHSRNINRFSFLLLLMLVQHVNFCQINEVNQVAQQKYKIFSIICLFDLLEWSNTFYCILIWI